MVEYMKDTSRLIVSMDMEYILGLTNVSMKGIGLITKCMAVDSSLGLKELFMLAIIKMTKSMDLDILSIQTIAAIGVVYTLYYIILYLYSYYYFL